MERLFLIWKISNQMKLPLLLSTSENFELLELGQCGILRTFKCSRMPYKDCERKEILEEIIRRQAYRILKVVHSLTILRLTVTALKTSVIDKSLGEHNLEAV